jgi:TolB-like protein/DNA-binding winged helix-turn-helix (wHTH) protein
MPPPPTPGNGSSQPRFRIGDLEVDVATAEVSRGDVKIPLPKLSFDLLYALINAAPAIVTNEDLLQRVWPGVLVSPESVAQRVKLLRSAIGDDSQQPRYILGVRGRGYRLIPLPERLEESRVTPGDADSAPKTTPGVGTPVVPASQNTPLNRSTSDLKPVFIAAAVLIAVGIIGAVGFRHWTSDHVARPMPVALEDRSIAVLPFTDMSEKKDQEYFADGMAEEIIDLLVKIPGLKVISPTSSFQFKGKTEDLRAIGTQLGVAYLLEGSIRKSGDHLRVTAQLIDSSSGTHLFSQTYDRDLSDVFKMQDEIAANLVRELQLEVDDTDVVSRPSLRNTEAYTEFLRGIHALYRFNPQDVEQSLTHFQRAFELDPLFPDASNACGVAYTLLGSWGLMPRAVAFEKAADAFDNALKLDPKFALAHANLGMLHLANWDPAGADREMHIALDLTPRDFLVLALAAAEAHAMGRWDETLKLVNASLALDPLNANDYSVLAFTQEMLGRPKEAEAAMRRALTINPALFDGHMYLGALLLAHGEPEAALPEMLKETNDGARLVGAVAVYFVLGRKADSDAALSKLVASQAETHPFIIAEAYASRGESDEALQWLDRAYLQKDGGLMNMASDLGLRHLLGDPRYKAFLKKMNLPDD